jgi:hypothetical protein
MVAVSERAFMVLEVVAVEEYAFAAAAFEESVYYFLSHCNSHFHSYCIFRIVLRANLSYRLGLGW